MEFSDYGLRTVIKIIIHVFEYTIDNIQNGRYKQTQSVIRAKYITSHYQVIRRDNELFDLLP